MKRYLCTNTCQIAADGRILFCEKDMAYDLDEDPGEHFLCLDELKSNASFKLDFMKSSEEELLAADWKFEEAKTAIFKALKIKLKFEKGMRKSEVVDQIMDARFRATAAPPVPNKTS